MASRSAGFLDQRKLHSPIKRDGRRKREKRTGSRAERERERDSVFTIESGNDWSSRTMRTINFGINFGRFLVRALFRFSVRLANKWKEMEKQVREEATTNRFPVSLHTLKEFLNGQITVERISNDTFERARSNWKPAVWKFLSRRDGDLAAGHLRHKCALIPCKLFIRMPRYQARRRTRAVSRLKREKKRKVTVK